MSDIADRILADIAALAPFEPREAEIGSILDAYRIQSEVNAALLAAQPGRRIAGYKIAFNRPSSMDYYHLQEPCYAPLFSDQIQGAGATLALAEFNDLVIEPEIGVRLGTPLGGAASAHEVLAAVSAWFPAIEVMDVRGAFARDPSAAAAVAQRVHSEGAVVGADAGRELPDMADIVARIVIDSATAGEATGNAPQAPLEALAWLAGRLAADVLPLDAGMIVLTGAHLPGHKIGKAGVIEVTLEPLGRVSLTVV